MYIANKESEIKYSKKTFGLSSMSRPRKHVSAVKGMYWFAKNIPPLLASPSRKFVPGFLSPNLIIMFAMVVEPVLDVLRK